MIKFSFIIPFYNVEQYIEECVRSIYDQDIPLEEYEVICVNDCSPDNSVDVVKRLQKEFSNLILIEHTENKKQVDFSNTELAGTSFVDSQLSNVNFAGADLNAAEFTRANLVECDFSEAVLNGTDFSYATVSYCNFTDADMAGCIVKEADLSNSDFSASENLAATRADETTVWPDNDLLPDDFDTNYTKEDEEDESESISDY